jgi:cytochrome c oxidase accessory protein FixG
LSTLNARQLPEDRLTTTDEEGRRVYIHPADVRGRFRNRRTVIHAIMILIFLVLPWIRIGGHPAILLDIAHRRFALFGLTFWAHDAPILLFVLAGGALTIGFITALWGRLWCGWACPQTVFVEGVFRKIERWIEGDAVARRQLARQPWNEDKVLKKVVKWAAFLVVGSVITHSFLAYFVGSDELLRMMRSSPAENPSPFLFILGATALVLFDFGWFREQFCTIVCPYGRFQSVLMDDHSWVVAYDGKRGEPRRGSTSPGEKEGDCVNCFRCVDVCPTGIDIRRGLQMECVACTACIDACDEVMEKLKRPLGLIRYDSLTQLIGQSKVRFGARAWIYLILLIIVATGFILTLKNRQTVDVAFVRAKEAPYQEIGGGLVINHYQVDLSNEGFEDLKLNFEVDSLLREKGVELVTAVNPIPVAAGAGNRIDLFVKFPKSLLSLGKANIQIQIIAKGNILEKQTKRFEEMTLVGPFQ